LRSLDDVHSPANIDYYEVFLRQRRISGGVIQPVNGNEKLFSGKANADEILRVAVPPERNYDVLLLGGRKKNMILLVSAFVNNRNGSGNTEYVANGDGILIKQDETNVIDLTLTYIESNPGLPLTGYTITELTTLTPHSVAAVTGGDYDAIYKTVLPARDRSTPTEFIGGGTGITVVVKTGGLKTTSPKGALTEADDQWAAGTYVHPTFSQAQMKILQYGNHPVDTMIAVGDTTDNDKVTYTFTLGAGGVVNGTGRWPDPDPAAPDAKNRGVYAKMYYELSYYAFGRTTITSGDDSRKGSKWVIKNGYDSSLDEGAGSEGGAVLLIIGTDPGDFIPWETVQVNP
jgi:hypothetical protein